MSRGADGKAHGAEIGLEHRHLASALKIRQRRCMTPPGSSSSSEKTSV
jgi:hypothetical protein